MSADVDAGLLDCHFVYPKVGSGCGIICPTHDTLAWCTQRATANHSRARPLAGPFSKTPRRLYKYLPCSIKFSASPEGHVNHLPRPVHSVTRNADWL